MAAPISIAKYEVSEDRENFEEPELARSWLTVLVILLAIGLYLTMDVEKKRLRQAQTVLVAEQTR